jgi:hypothetical protein
MRSYVSWAEMQLANVTSSDSVVGDADVLVSLTTYGTRIDSVAFAIESVAAGRMKPKRMVLWLDRAERGPELPASLKRLRQRGLEILWTENYRSHKKYWPSLALALDAGTPIVTADDDILYPRSWLQGLCTSHTVEPHAVTCYRASVISTSQGRIEPYARWPRCRSTKPSLTHFATSGAGALYPLPMLTALEAQGTAFLDRAATADDIWLHWVGLQAGIPTRQLSERARLPPFIPGTQGETLARVNIEEGGNDRWIRSLYSSQDIERLERARLPATSGDDRSPR